MMGRDYVAMLASWELDPLVVVALPGVLLWYLRGWLTFRRRCSSRFTTRHLVFFMLGIAVLYVALQSPLDTFGAYSLQVHMVQHMLLIIVSAPLMLLGAPTLPLVSGSPRWFRDEWITPFAHWPFLRRFLRGLCHKATAWIVFAVTLWLWHTPLLYELALRSPFWHRVEHAAFLMASLLFWWPIIEPYPYRSKVTRWALLPYLLSTAVHCTVLAGLITFSDQLLYSHYARVPNIWGLPPLTDQALAGAIMWVPMSLALLPATVWIVHSQMTSAADVGRRVVRRTTVNGMPRAFSLDERYRRRAAPSAKSSHGTHHSFSIGSLLGLFVKRRRIRRGLQLGLVLFALLVVVDGLTGPQVSSINLAGVGPWIFWRGLLVFALAVGGNFFCMSCPFMATRSITSRLSFRKWSWPRGLRTKWIAVVLLTVFFWAYEAFSLWDRPFWTAVIVLAYFLSAAAFSVFFADAPFCKFTCPIGQFNFVYSLLSPAEVTICEPAVCANCQTRDCLVGNSRSMGCQLSLLQPSKAGNMDCTFCLDCADACPHNNVAILPVRPAGDLTRDVWRSGVGRYSCRADLTTVVIVLLFASLVNAAWMTAPGIRLEENVTSALGVHRLWTVTLGMIVGLVIVPMIVCYCVARVSESFGQRNSRWTDNVGQFAVSLVPLSLGMWLAHFSFHLFTSGSTIYVAVARMIGDWSGSTYAVTSMTCNCCRASTVHWLLPLELLFLDVGLCFSLLVAFRTAQRGFPGLLHSLRAFLPWCVLLLVLFSLCIWTLLQPMEMRGALT
ncbi:MAG: cytochrome c oxidase assembly protein [Planctomycetales bacterium]|nr:cytochrome c oxidase assembly protein [Planctomycetales bacterium]